MKKSFYFSLFAAIACSPFMVYAQEQIIPRPAKIEVAAAESPIEINASTRIVAGTDLPKEFIEEAKKIIRTLSAGTGLKLKGTHKIPNGGNAIILKEDPALKTKGDEAYKILADARGNITLSAGTPRGLFYATQSLLQMLPVEFFNAKAAKENVRWKIADHPFEIVDFPRFGWRCVHLDEARHFFGMETVKRILDQMALLKMNVFHWHLTDDAGWRIEIKKYPRLTQIGSSRKNTEIGTWGSGKFSGKPHAGFYTQEQIKEIVEYAAQRHITIVPEIEMPGHASAATVAYPWLSLKPTKEVPTTFIVNTAFDPTSERTYEFLSNVLDEVVALFPSKVIHVGGDEVRYNDQWKGQPKIEAFMKEKGIKSLGDLHLYFSNRLSRIVAGKGRRMMGWNEIFGEDVNNDGGGITEDTLDPNAVIHFWKGNAESAKKAIRAGHDIVNSSNWFTYMDYGYDRLSLEKAYSFEPIWDKLEDRYHKHILGIGCQMWTEWVDNQKRLDYMMFPRVLAYSEVAWTQKNRKDFLDFKRRIRQQCSRMEIQGINYAEEAVSAISNSEISALPNIGRWTPKDLGKGDSSLCVDISSHINAAGRFEFLFVYEKGACGIDIESVSLFENGREISVDQHQGFSGNAKRKIVYTLKLSARKPNARYELKAKIKGAGGNDSYGKILMRN